MSEINIVITNGTIFRKFYWLKQTPNGIYHGYHLKEKENLYHSYHSDGNSWITIKNKKIDKHTLIPLESIKEITNLLTLGFNPSNFEKVALSLKAYESYKNLKGIVWIDIRSFSINSTVNISLNLVRPEYLSKLFSFSRYKQKNKKEFHLIRLVNSINPWLLIHAIGLEKPIQKN